MLKTKGERIYHLYGGAFKEDEEIDGLAMFSVSL